MHDGSTLSVIFVFVVEVNSNGIVSLERLACSAALSILKELSVLDRNLIFTTSRVFSPAEPWVASTCVVALELLRCSKCCQQFVYEFCDTISRNNVFVGLSRFPSL